MVAQQIAARGVSDPRVLAAMRAVPRHHFVGEAYQAQAYADRPLPIAEGQTISQPYIVAIMTAALEVRVTDRVLEIGTGSGYQTAVLAQLAAEVVSIERHAALAEGATTRLLGLAIRNVSVVVADGSEGWPSGAPYDRILVTAGDPAIPEALPRNSPRAAGWSSRSGPRVFSTSPSSSAERAGCPCAKARLACSSRSSGRRAGRPDRTRLAPYTPRAMTHVFFAPIRKARRSE